MKGFGPLSGYIRTVAANGLLTWSFFGSQVKKNRPRGGGGGGGGGGVSAYERCGDARRKFWIKVLKETDLGVAQAFFDR